jgi:hypothetical protein
MDRLSQNMIIPSAYVIDKADSLVPPGRGRSRQRQAQRVGDADRAKNRPAKPDEESPTFKRVRQARRHEVWRVAHPYDPDVAVRIICWFPANDQIVLALAGLDKKPIGDVFYSSVVVAGSPSNVR